MRLLSEIRAIAAAAHISGKVDLEKVNFLQTRPLREAIHSRERGLCFYCSRRLSPRTRCLDHVIPRVHCGGNSFRNMVSCCGECNSLKADRGAEVFSAGSSARAAWTPPNSPLVSARRKPSPPAICGQRLKK